MAAKAFTAISLFSQLQEPMTALPNHIFALFHGMPLGAAADIGLKPHF
jgi:hypothetical protein